MGDIIKPVKICGIKSCETTNAFFDTGSPYSLISRELAEKIGIGITKFVKIFKGLKDKETTLEDLKKMSPKEREKIISREAIAENIIIKTKEKECKRPMAKIYIEPIKHMRGTDLIVGKDIMQDLGLIIDMKKEDITYCEPKQEIFPIFTASNRINIEEVMKQ